MTEIVRLLTVFTCFANIGAVAGLFGRVGKFIIPKTTVRLLMLGNVVVVATIGTANLAHIHRPTNWFGYLILTGATLKLGAIVALWEWYGTPAGEQHIERMVGSVDRHRDTDEDVIWRRLRQLAMGMFGLYGIAFASIIVVGYFGAITHDSLCTFRGDLEHRADTSRAILTAPENRGKEWVMVYGLRIRRSVIANQLHGQEATLASLNGLRC